MSAATQALSVFGRAAWAPAHVLWLAGTVAAALSGPAALWCGVALGDWSLGVAVHLLGSLLAYALYRRATPGHTLLARQAGVLVVCFPLVGSLCVWWLYGRPSSTEAGVLDEYRRYIAYQHVEARWLTPAPNSQEIMRRELSVRPLAEQLAMGDPVTKQAAAQSLARLGRDEGVRVLRQALSADEPDTRLFASLALLKKEEAYVALLNTARAAAEQGDVAPLAHAARAYAESGLPSGRAAEGLWREAASAAERGLSAGLPPDLALALRLDLAAARRALGDVEGALAMCEQTLAEAPGTFEAAWSRCELLYGLGRFDELAEAASALAEAAPDTDAAELAAYWRPAA